MSVDLAILKILEGNGTDLHHLLQVIPASSLLRTQIVWDSSNNPIYVGISLSDVTLNDPKWMIRKINWDTSNNPTQVLFADGEIKFNKVFNSYLSYTYTAT